MYGQEVIKDLVHNNRVGDNKFIILVGDKGQGKRTASSYIARNLIYNYQEVYDLKVDNLRSVIDDSYNKRNRVLYCLYSDTIIPNKVQNLILKWTEEPPTNAMIILCTLDSNSILPTLMSRSICKHLDNYTQEDLKKFTDDSYLLNVCGNIGEIKRCQELDLDEIQKYLRKIYNNIGRITKANVFNMWKHFLELFKDKENLDLFFKMLIKEYYNDILKYEYVEELYILYDYYRFAKVKGVDKKHLFEICMLKLRLQACQE